MRDSRFPGIDLPQWWSQHDIFGKKLGRMRGLCELACVEIWCCVACRVCWDLMLCPLEMLPKPPAIDNRSKGYFNFMNGFAVFSTINHQFIPRVFSTLSKQYSWIIMASFSSIDLVGLSSRWYIYEVWVNCPCNLVLKSEERDFFGQCCDDADENFAKVVFLIVCRVCQYYNLWVCL